MMMFSWEIPIEDELLKWARYMRQSNERYVRHSVWGNKQKREAQIYANVFEMVEKRIEREMKLRTPIKPLSNKKGK